jgi:hypothetical protein
LDDEGDAIDGNRLAVALGEVPCLDHCYFPPSMLLVLKTEFAEGLRWDCRGAEVGTSARSEAAQVRACPVVVGWTCGGEVLRRVRGSRRGVPVPVRGAKQRTVLALLALHRGQPVSADRLIDALWGDGQVANPVKALDERRNNQSR